MGWIENAGLDIKELINRISNQIDQTKACVKSAESLIEKKKVKAMRNAGDDFCKVLDALLTVVKEYEWLISKFGEDGEYKDISGLCRIATTADIAEKNYSLTPGAYVGVAEVEDDGVDFYERMMEIHLELNTLSAKASELMREINKNWEALA